MNRLKKYFQSFDSFILFVYGARRRVLETYYWIFKTVITKRLEKLANRCIDTDSFLKRLDELLQLPNKIEIEINESVQINFQAVQYLNGIYDLLGSGNKELHTIDWHTDFKSGYRWAPGQFYKKYKQEEIDTNADVKLPRELSRAHQLIKVGISYQLNRQESLAQFCVEQMNDWISNNKLMCSINWGCTMDVAIRAVNWVWAIGLVSDTKSLDKKSVEKIKISFSNLACNKFPMYTYCASLFWYVYHRYSRSWDAFLCRSDVVCTCGSLIPFML